MNVVHIYLDPEACPKGEVRPQDCIKVNGCSFTRIPKGTVEGNSSVAITCPLPGGKHLFLEITMANFEMVAAAFQGAEARAKQ